MDDFQKEVTPTELSSLGLNKLEATVYHNLLLHGSAYPSTISSRTQVSRPTCYRVLDDLNRKGLIIRFRKGKKFFYEASHPKNLERYVQQKQERVSKQLKHAQHLQVPLQKLYLREESLHNIQYYEGKDKYRIIVEDALNFPNSEVNTIVNIELVEQMIDSERFIKSYVKRRARSHITNLSLIPKSQRELVRPWLSKYYPGLPKPFLPRYRYMDDEKVEAYVYMRIYADRVSFFDLSTVTHTGIIITNRLLSETMKHLFRQLWKQAKDV